MTRRGHKREHADQVKHKTPRLPGRTHATLAHNIRAGLMDGESAKTAMKNARKMRQKSLKNPPKMRQ